MTPEGTYTYNELIGTIRARLKLFDQEKYAKKTIFNDIYRAMCELAELSGTKNDPRYRESQVIPVTKSVVSNSSAAVTYTSSSKLLTVPLYGTNPNNVWTNDSNGFDSTWEGAVGTISYDDGTAPDAPTGNIITKKFTIVSGSTPGTGQATIDSATTLLFPAGFITGTLTTPTHPILSLSIVSAASAVVDLIDLSALAMYKHIDRITAIEDSVNGLCVEMPEKDFRAIKHYAAAENDYSDTVIWYRAGSLLYFCLNSLTSYGVRTMYFIRNPYKPTAYTDIVDYPDTQMKMLIDVCVTTILQSLNVQLPQELQSVANRLQAMRAAVNEERQKAEANYKTQ